MKTLSLLAMILAGPATAQNLTIARASLDADCNAFLLARTAPDIVRPEVVLFYDAFFTGAAIGGAWESRIMEQYEAICQAEPNLEVDVVMQRAVQAAASSN